jgi:hypothetical protein
MYSTCAAVFIQPKCIAIDVLHEKGTVVSKEMYVIHCFFYHFLTRLKTLFSMLGLLLPVFSKREIISRVEKKVLGFPVKFSRCIPEDLKG